MVVEEESHSVASAGDESLLMTGYPSSSALEDLIAEKQEMDLRAKGVFPPTAVVPGATSHFLHPSYPIAPHPGAFVPVAPLLTPSSVVPRHGAAVATDEDGNAGLSPKVTIMQPILRFLQLLCENHNRFMQNFLRHQGNKTNYNLVSESLMFLDCICGSTTGGLGLLGLYINETNFALINQTLETLVEYCQVMRKKCFLSMALKNAVFGSLRTMSLVKTKP